MRRTICALAVVLCAGPAAAAQTSPEVFAALAEFSLPTPNKGLIVYCSGYNCRKRTLISLTSADRARIAHIMAPGRASPRAERKAVAAAVGWFDRRAGRIAGTTHRVAKAGIRMSLKAEGQLDCIDSSRNTMGMLVLLNRMGLLRHHRIDAPKARGYLVDMRPPHVTAVLTELKNKRKWSIDLWTVSAGIPPEVMPLKRWLELD